MKYAVRYYTKTGNTEKLAMAAASVLGVEAANTSAPLEEKVDVLFLGSSVYAAGVDQAIVDFIKANKEKIGTIVNISTAALIPSTFKQVEKIAKENGVKMCEKEFHCRGSFAMLHKNHPNADDISALKEFVKEVTK